MGLNIRVYDDEYNDHPEWDWIRYVNDNTFADLIDWSQAAFSKTEGRFRPTNIQKLQEQIEATAWRNKARYLQLLGYVEQGWWLYFSR